MPNQYRERSDAEKAEILAYRRQHGAAKTEVEHGVSGATMRRWARDLGESPLHADRLRQAAHELGKADKAIPTEAAFLHAHPEFTDKKVASLDVWGMFDLIEGMQQSVSESSPGQDAARVTIPATEPVIVLPTADWHLGSYASSHVELRKYIKRVLATDGCYLMLLGDEVESFPSSFKSAAAVFGQVIPPKIQHRLLSGILHELHRAGRIVARTWGNHNLMGEAGIGGADYDYETLVPYLKTMGKLYLTVGSVEYRIFASHTFSGKSYLHVGHQNKRAVRMTWPDADVVLSGHTHSGPEHEQFWHDERPIVSATVGTAKIDDSYSKRYYGQSRWSDQALVLHHDTREVVPFRTFDQALTYRDGWRARQKRAA
jgi:hypothetical protein